MTEKEYKINEAGKFLGKSVATLQRWDRDGELAAKRTNTNRRYYTQRQLDDCLVKVKTKHDPLYFFERYTDQINGETAIGRSSDTKKALKQLADHKDIFITSVNAGDGKMTLIKDMAKEDKSRRYYQIKITNIMEHAMIGDNFDEYLFNQIILNILQTAHMMSYLSVKDNIALVFDEFTELFIWSNDANNVLAKMIKTPLVNIIMIDTRKNYDWFIKKQNDPNKKIRVFNLPPLGEQNIIKILQRWAIRYQVYDDIDNPNELFHNIYVEARKLKNGRAVLRNACNLLDNMIGFHRAMDLPLNTETLNKIVNDLKQEETL